MAQFRGNFHLVVGYLEPRYPASLLKPSTSFKPGLRQRRDLYIRVMSHTRQAKETEHDGAELKGLQLLAPDATGKFMTLKEVSRGLVERFLHVCWLHSGRTPVHRDPFLRYQIEATACPDQLFPPIARSQIPPLIPHLRILPNQPPISRPIDPPRTPLPHARHLLNISVCTTFLFHNRHISNGGPSHSFFL